MMCVDNNNIHMNLEYIYSKESVLTKKKEDKTRVQFLFCF